MSFPPVPVDGQGLDWPRKVANAIKQLQGILSTRETMPFQMLSADPANPVEGQSYYSTATHKVRVYDGTAWMNL